MKSLLVFLLPGLFVLAAFCSSEEFEYPVLDSKEFVSIEKQSSLIQPGSLLINEYLAMDSKDRNEFCRTSDWFEIYNPGTDTVFLESNRWFFSDKEKSPQKYQLPIDTYIAPKDYLIVWCDGKSRIKRQIHTNFKLKAIGEGIWMHYQNDEGELIRVDGLEFMQQLPGVSEGRCEEGWTYYENPTPAFSNEEG